MKLILIIIAGLYLTQCSAFFEGDEGVILAPQRIKPLILKEIASGFRHEWADDSYHLVGAAVIDSDQDGRFELFVGGGLGQEDVLLSFENGRVKNKIAGTGLSSLDATYGATAIDINNDGLVDLIAMRDQSATIYYAKGDGRFEARPLRLNLPPHSVALNATPIDIERDGDIDLYISVFIDARHFRSVTYNDPSHVRYNILLRNDGAGRWVNITDKTSRGLQNSFTALAADLDGDGYQDLVIAQNTGEVEFLRNNQGKGWTNMNVRTGYGFWMGIGAGDIDNDGDLDMLFSNSGSSVPEWILQGDIKPHQKFRGQWILLRNDGRFRFTDITKKARLDALGFGWGAVFEDINYDGFLDMIGAQNYVNWPFHYLYKINGKIMLNDPLKAPYFYLANNEIGENPYFSHSPLWVDMNGDGRKDLVWVNADGPLRILLNMTKGNHINVRFPDNAQSLGAVMEATISGKTYRRQITSAQGLTVDSPPSVSFGLGKALIIDELVMIWSSGERTKKTNLKANQTINIKP